MASSFRSLTWSLVAAGALVSVSAGGCGGSAFTGSPSSGDDGGPSGDASTGVDSGSDSASGDSATGDGSAGDGAVSAGCPATLSAGQSCAAGQEGLQCETGTDPNVDCNVVYECNSGTFRETTVSTPLKAKTCPTPSFPKENKCPGTQGLASGQACTDDGLECAYATGICACTGKGGSGGPVTTPKWVCPRPDNACPNPRPPVGSACTTEGKDCDYGSCVYGGGVDEKCSGGVWTVAGVACAG